MSWLDPTALMCLAALTVPMLSEAETAEDNWLFVTDPFVVGTFIAMVLVALAVRREGVKALPGDARRKARWFLWTGSVMHFLLGGVVGGLGQVPLLVAQQRAADRRYASLAVWGFHSTPVTLGYLEASIWAPLCVGTYYTLRRGHAAAAPLQLLASTLQCISVVMRYLPEYLEGYPNIVTDPNFEFTPHHLTYFWFGCGLNVVGFLIPAMYCVDAFHQCCARGAVKAE